MRRAVPVLLTIAALAVVGSNAAAAPVFYTSRAAFNAAAGGGLTFQSFEQSQGVLATYTYPGFTVSETGGINGITHTSINGVFGTVPVTNGTGAIWFDDNGSSLGVFQFGSQINAFGIDLTTDTASTITVGGDINSSFNTAANTPTFFGVIDPTGTFDLVSFSPSGGPLVGFDSAAFGIAAPIPEPSSLALFGLMGVGAAAYYRRRKAQAV